MFYFQADRGHHEHFFRNADVVVMNVDVVELSASSKKDTFIGQAFNAMTLDELVQTLKKNKLLTSYLLRTKRT